MPYTGGDDKLGGIVGGGDGLLGDYIDNWVHGNYIALLEALLVVVVLVVLWNLWNMMMRREKWGEGGKNVERQTMDQSYFTPPYEYTPAAQAAARREGMENPRDKSYAAQAVAGPGSGVTSLADLIDQQARAKFLVDNQCEKRGTPYMGDPWTWLVDAAKEGYMGQRESEGFDGGAYVSDPMLVAALAQSGPA